MGAPAEGHDYRRCTDDNCPRFSCQAYKEGYEDGRRHGFDEGHAEGFEAGYKQGFGDGIDACPRPHGKR